MSKDLTYHYPKQYRNFTILGTLFLAFLSYKSFSDLPKKNTNTTIFIPILFFFLFIIGAYLSNKYFTTVILTQEGIIINKLFKKIKIKYIDITKVEDKGYGSKSTLYLHSSQGKFSFNLLHNYENFQINFFKRYSEAKKNLSL